MNTDQQAVQANPNTLLDPSQVQPVPLPVTQPTQPNEVIDPMGHTAIDPNTLKAASPLPTVAGRTANEQQQYVDEWKKDPTGMPPVRTWVDAQHQHLQGPNGEYLQAWYDQPAEVARQPNPSGMPAHSVAQVPAATQPPVSAPVASPVVAPITASTQISNTQ